MKFYNLVIGESQKETLLRSLGNSYDNALDEFEKGCLSALFDDVNSAEESDEDFVFFKQVTKKSLGYMGNQLLKVMRKIVECEENGCSGDLSWYTHELCAMIRGISAAGFEVLIKPDLLGAFRRIEVEGMSFEV